MFSQDEVREMRALGWKPAKKAPQGVESWTLDQATAGCIVNYAYGYDHEQGMCWREIEDRSDRSLTYEWAEDK